MLCTHTHALLNYSALCQQPGSISSNGERRSYTHRHTPKHKHTSFIARGGLVSSPMPLRPNTNVHTHGIFLSTWLQLGAEQDKELHQTSLNTDRWEARSTSRCPPSLLTYTNKQGRIQGQRQWVNRPLPAGSLEKRVSLFNSAVICVTSRKQQWLTDKLHQIYEWR